MKVSRRRFVTLSGLGLVGISLASLPQSIKRSWGSTNNQFIQPLNLKNESNQPGLAEFSLKASSSKVKLPGREGIEAELMTYNGSFPGPTLRVKEGDRVRIHLQNDLDQSTNLHLHGLHVSPEGQGDNPFRVIKPGQTALYEFSIPKNSAGIYWYHPHYHGNSNVQLFAGLAGTIIVDGSLNIIPELRNIPDYLVILKDLEVDTTGKIPTLTRQDWMNGREGSLVLINGVTKPIIQTDAKLVRLRFSNQSSGRYYNLKLAGHSMTVIATDGGFVNTPYSVDSLLLTPGERYEVLVNFKQTGDIALLNLPYVRGRTGIDQSMDMSGMGNNSITSGSMPPPEHQMEGMQSPEGVSGMNNMPGMSNVRTQPTGEGSIMTLRFTGSPQIVSLPSRINSIQALSPKDIVQKRTIKFTEVMEMLSFSFNGKEFDPNRVDIRSKLGTVELWELVNDSDMDHPFHLHINAFQVYSRNGKLEPQLTWKDVVNVKSKETVQILTPFADFTGKTVFHCHVLEHEERGMMGVVEIIAG